MLVSIDIIKAIACLLIVNFHCLYIYPDKIKFLSFGGDIGNNIFFFVSGFLLVSSINKTPLAKFWGWNKRRMIRILPLCVVFNSIIFLCGVKEKSIGSFFLTLVFPTAYWFTGAILLFYPLLFFLEKIKRKWILLFLVLILLVSHVIFDSIHAERYIMGFVSMICGCELQIDSEETQKKRWNTTLLFAPLLFFLYAVLKVSYSRGLRLGGITHLAIGIVTIVFAAAVVKGLVREEEILKRLQNGRVHKCIVLVSKLTLPLYLCQQFVNTFFVEAFLVAPFPFSVLLYLLVVFVFALFTWRVGELLTGRLNRLLA